MVLTNLHPPPPPHGEKCTVNVININEIIQHQGGAATLRPAQPISLNHNHLSVVAKAIHLLPFIPFSGGRHPHSA